MLSFLIMWLLTLEFTIATIPPTQAEPEAVVIAPEDVAETSKEEPKKDVAPVTPTEPTAPAKQPSPVVPAQPITQPNVLHITSMMDYEELVQDLCPSERPATDFQYEGLLPALGLSHSGGNTKTIADLRLLVALHWDSWHLHPDWYDHKTALSALSNIGLGQARISFFGDFPNQRVFYANTWSDDDFDRVELARQEHPELIKQLDAIASNMTTYLRQLESSYNAKCPND